VETDRTYEKWLEENMVAEMDYISRTEYKHFFGTLKKAHQTISRSIELFRNLLADNIEKVLGIKPKSVDWVVEVSEPVTPTWHLPRSLTSTSIYSGFSSPCSFFDGVRETF
jgi:hypothetical protein